MKAIRYQSYGDYGENRLVDLPRPPLRDGDVLVAMRAVGVNPLDNTFRSGHFYLATPQNLPAARAVLARGQGQAVRQAMALNDAEPMGPLRSSRDAT